MFCHWKDEPTKLRSFAAPQAFGFWGSLDNNVNFIDADIVLIRCTMMSKDKEIVHHFKVSKVHIFIYIRIVFLLVTVEDNFASPSYIPHQHYIP